MSKWLDVRVMRLERGDDPDGCEYVVREYGPRCSVDLFRGDIAECEDFALQYIEDNSQFGVGA